MESSGNSNALLFSLPALPGGGDAVIAWQPGSGGLLVTAGGNDQQAFIYNRHGKLQERIHLPGICSSLCWDVDGDILAAASDKSPRVVLWDAHKRRSQPLDTGLGDAVSFLAWNRAGPPMLAVGTVKGNLMLYSHKSAKRLPVLGKHSRRVTCGAWSKEGLLALGSEDRNLTISNIEGDTLRAIPLRAEPSHIRFSEMKLDERLQGENTVSMLIGKKTLFLYNMHDPENPVELAFQQRYGSVVTYEWFGDGYILLGFSAGYFVAISTHIKEIGQELFQVKNHRDNLTDIAMCMSLGQTASCGDNMVKLHSLSELPETRRVLTLEMERSLTKLAWSSDGQLLAASGASGAIHVFLLQLPPLASSSQSRAALLTSLTTVSVTRQGFQEPYISIHAEIEPSFLAVGPLHMACGMNNRAWFYKLKDSSAKLLQDQEYLGTVSNMQLSAEYASVLFEGRLQIHAIEPDNDTREPKVFPEMPAPNEHITCHALTPDTLIYGTEAGNVLIFLLEEWKEVQEFRHGSALRGVYPEPAGSRIALLNEHRQAFIYCPVTEQVIPMPTIPVATEGIMWDTWPSDHSILIAYDSEVAVTFVLVRESVNGPYVNEVGITKLPQGQTPLWLSSGELGLHTNQGHLTRITLDTHTVSVSIPGSSSSELLATLTSQLALKRYKDAWMTCHSINSQKEWKLLAEAALKDIEIEIAMRSYRQIKDAGMVLALESIQEVEDRNLLAGHIALFLKDFPKAQEWYLKSSRPLAALEMQKDLLQWEEALQLASSLAPSQIPFLAREFAQQLEFTGQYVEARAQYERAALDTNSKEHAQACVAGLARTSLRCGDVRRGLALANESANRTLLKECAEILEVTKQLSDAAILYEKSNLPDKAADLYIRLKNWARVGDLIPQITSPKIHIQYAKAKEAEGRYVEAVKAYEAARDYDNVIRIHLEHLKNPEQAVKVVKETKSIEGAKMVAKFFRQLGDMASALQFLVASHCTEEAFQLARQSGQMALYGRLLGSDSSPDDYRSIARHFEGEQDLLLAGRYFHLAGDDAKAIKFLLKAAQLSADNKEALQLAVEAAGSAEDQSLADQVINFVCGDIDGVPKDFKYVFRLYIARKQFEEASQVAIMMAEEEQKAGNYRNAHDTLLSMYQELRSRNMKTPEVLRSRLSLLHSYTLARLHVRRGEHLLAARMLARVAANISKFPAHVVPILTSAVIECHRAGLSTTAFNLATILMRPLHRPHLDPKYKRKIESVVRKPVREAEPPEPTSPCPYCDEAVADTELLCARCKNTIPFCIATGRHIVKSDFTACPHCEFPAIKSEFAKLLQTEHSCPMCGGELEVSGLSSLENIKDQLYPDDK